MHFFNRLPLNSCRPINAKTAKQKSVRIITSFKALTDSIRADTIAFNPGCIKVWLIKSFFIRYYITAIYLNQASNCHNISHNIAYTNTQHMSAHITLSVYVVVVVLNVDLTSQHTSSLIVFLVIWFKRLDDKFTWLLYDVNPAWTYLTATWCETHENTRIEHVRASIVFLPK